MLLIMVIALIAHFLTGSSKLSGSSIGSKRDSTSLSCFNDNMLYPFFRYDNSSKKEIRVDARFIDEDVESISIKLSMSYGNNDEANTSEIQNRAALGIRLGNDGLNADDLSMSYSTNDGTTIISMYADKAKIDNVTEKYFLINDDVLKRSANEYMKLYQTQGFQCAIQNNQ